MDENISLLKNLRLYTETYGCTYNFGDTAKLIEIAKAQGCTITENPREAEAVLINTCIVIDKTEQHMYERLTLFANKKLFITGCLPPVAEVKLRELYPDAVIIPDEKIHPCWREVGTVAKGSRTAVLQIARGCPGHCTYCVTRLARGKLVSFPMEDIIAQAKAFAAGGAAELQLTAQDTTAWGIDFGEEGLRLPDLLRELCKIEGDFKIRIGMANPDTLLPVLDDLLDAMADEKIFLFLHIPVQSGSDSVLKLMGRRYTAEQYEYIVKKARDRYPDIRICTDYIAGFSNETDADADISVGQVMRTRPGKVNITRFSVRPKTPAAKMKRIAEPVKKARSKVLTDAVNQIYDETCDSWIGRTVDCLVTEIVKPGSVTARNRTYQNIVISEDLPIGTKCRVLITGHRRHYLLARRV
ncbi:MAG TPA: tRNA (N(6)-L-threonylcarbamoyladenosine(37)-C(2))-methylthiotransferase [Methanocorpusculum sp.]|nr:tRNA (N(6)-L-threonylcarbamoyladenosine(37)-C(2))-methylthiotransferase [Methanocorpusculum sp.]